MNPLIQVDQKTGIFSANIAKTREEFLANIDALHKHFVVEGGWIDPNTLSSKPKPYLVSRWLSNIVNVVAMTFFVPSVQTDLDKIKNGLSSYFSANVVWIAKDKSELSEDFALKVIGIDLAIKRKDVNSYLSKLFKRDFVSPSTWPWIMVASRIAKFAGLSESSAGALEIFDKLGWDYNKAGF